MFKHRTKKEITLECKNCGKKFLKRPSESKNGKGQFCSQKCYHQSSNKKIKEKSCEFIEWNKLRVIKSSQTRKKLMKYVKQKHNNPWSYISLCQGCGNFFFVRERNEVKKRKYCSQICSNTDHSTLVTKICETCGEEYSVQLNRAEESKYCSPKCSYESRYTGEYRTCPICNNEFYVIKAKIKKGEGKFCSKECASKSLEKKIKIKCKNCGKEHNIPPSRIKNSKDYFCDINCYYKSLPKKIVKNCEYCGEEFLTQPSVNRIFCDNECRQKANKDKKIERICKTVENHF